MSTREWFTNLPGSPSIKWAAETSGVDQLSAEIVIKLCQALGKSPVDGLVKTGHIVPEDFNGAGIIGALQRATNQQIITEAGRRMENR